MTTYAVNKYQVERFLELRKNGTGYNQACSILNIPTSTMRNTLKRLGLFKSSKVKKVSNEVAQIEYQAIKTSKEITIITMNDNNYYTIPINHKLAEHLLNNQTMYMTESMLKEISINKSSKSIQVVMSSSMYEFINIDKRTYKGVVLSDSLIELIKVSIDKTDKACKRIIKFADKLIENPDERVVKQLYDFMKHSDISIAKNGDIIAYKSVRSDFYDHHSGTILNSVGSTIEMDRNKVDNDPNSTCSHGLHVGSKSYITQIYNKESNLLECRVNPKDVVSVPTDYQGGKCRVCKYKVKSLVEDLK